MSKKLTPEMENDLADAYLMGQGIMDLQDRFGVNKITIRKILVSKGVTIRGKGRPKGSKNRKKKVEDPFTLDPSAVPPPVEDTEASSRYSILGDSFGDS